MTDWIYRLSMYKYNVNKIVLLIDQHFHFKSQDNNFECVKLNVNKKIKCKKPENI